jgi:hypothetical protein
VKASRESLGIFLFFNTKPSILIKLLDRHVFMQARSWCISKSCVLDVLSCWTIISSEAALGLMHNFKFVFEKYLLSV